jgi:hypothetical protein
MWLAGGIAATNNLIYSYDGLTWATTGSGLFGSSVDSIVWNGAWWIVWGQIAAFNAAAFQSQDGFSWTSATFTGGQFPAYLYFMGFTIPSYSQQNLEILPTSAPTFLNSTNQIFVTQSTILLNNTLSIDSVYNYVGVNNTYPRAALDVGGTGRIQNSIISTLLVGQPTTIPSTSAFLLNLTRDLATKPTTTTWTVTSDQRIKDDIRDADYDRCYNDIKAVQLRRFTWADNFFQTVEGYDKRVLGFIAQEVSTIVPKAVRIGDGYGFSNFHYLNIDQLNMSLYGAVKKTISDKEVMESTIKGQRIQIETLQGITTTILSTLEGLQGR